MKFRILLSLLVLVLAGVVIYFDGGALVTGISMAGGLPLMSLDFDGEDNLPGIARAFLIDVDDIDTEAVPISNPTSGIEKITIVGSHTLATGKYFSKLYSTQGKGTASFSSEGGRDFENFALGATLFYPCTKKESLALSTTLLGKDLIVLLEQNSDEEFFLQAGNKKLPARLVAAGDWGTELNGEKGITFTLSAFHGKKPFFAYEGVIPLAADDIYS